VEINFKLKNINSNVSDSTSANDKTHNLSFTAAETPVVGASMFGQPSMTLPMTASEAAGFTLGTVYVMTLTPQE